MVVVVVVIIMITVRTLIDIIIGRWHVGIIITTVLIILGVFLSTRIRIRDGIWVVTIQLAPTGCPCFVGNTCIPWSRSIEGGILRWWKCSIIITNRPGLGGFHPALSSFVIRIIIVIVFKLLLGVFLLFIVTVLLFLLNSGNTIV